MMRANLVDPTVTCRHRCAARCGRRAGACAIFAGGVVGNLNYEVVAVDDFLAERVWLRSQ